VPLFGVMCCQVQVSVTGQSLFQRSPTTCSVSECDLKTSTMRRSRPTMTVKPRKKSKPTKVPSMKKLRADFTQGMLAIILC
jgi:hypothetical protein